MKTYWVSIEPFSILQQPTKTFDIKDVEKLCLMMPNNGVITDVYSFQAKLEIFMNTFSESETPANNDQLKRSWQKRQIFQSFQVNGVSSCICG